MKTRKKPETLVPGSDIVDSAILKLPQEERVIVQRLRILVKECLPRASEQAYYGMGVPFYRHNRLICFIWPSSMSWGPKRTAESNKSKGTTLGFCQGSLMANEGGLLLAEGRKQVYCMYIHSMKEINEPQIRALLFEAEMIDQRFAKKKKRSPL